MSYSQALEEQIRLLRCIKADGEAYFADQAELAWVYAAAFAMNLETAEPFYWSPEMCDMLASVAPSMPTWTLRSQDLLASSGFMHFSKPLPLPDLADGSPNSPIGAIGWFFDPDGEDGVGQISINIFKDRDGRNYPCLTFPYRDGESMDAFVDYASENGASNDPKRAIVLAVGYIGAALAFCQQRILTTSQQRSERQTRKRLAAEGFTHEPLVRVVELRRKQTRSEHHGDAEPVEWSHQWIVSGHWRQQWYPSLNANQPRWIMPYVKGPEGKPLKPSRAKVFAVVR